MNAKVCWLPPINPSASGIRFLPSDMMTVAAVDRLVHHALIVELQAESYRKRSADQRLKTQDVAQTDSRSGRDCGSRPNRGQ